MSHEKKNSFDDANPAMDDELAEVLETYLRSVEAGEAPDVESLIECHPAIADRLRACLSSLQLVNWAADAMATPVATDPLELAQQTLGDYRLRGEIGRGGMGVVYEAEQISLGRRVALKVLPFATLLDARRLQRFKNEAQAAAGLDHPQIVSVYAVGCERGVHYYAMQFIDGRSLADVIDQLKLDNGDVQTGGQNEEQIACGPAIDEKTMPSSAATDTQPIGRLTTATPSRSSDYFRWVARLGVEISEALEYAHQMGVVHRDIKPSNLLIDSAGHVWITDFGVAMTHTDANLTMSGDLLGTLRYMSPEQASGRPSLYDHRIDIYSVGVTLYELLTLQPPYPDEDRAQLLQQIINVPPRPLRRLRNNIPRDLETIVLKAMSKEPSNRYESAEALAEDLRCYLDGKPIRARRIPQVQRVWRWCARNTLAASALALAASLLLFLAIAGPLTAIKQATLVSETQDALYVSDLALAWRHWEDGNLTGVYQLLDRQRRIQPPESLGYEWHYLWGLYNRSVKSPFTHPSADVAILPDGTILATAGLDGTIKLWDIATKKQLDSLSRNASSIESIAFDPDGQRLAAAGADGSFTLWDVQTGNLISTRKLQKAELFCIAWSPDGQLLAIGGREHSVQLWDVGSNELTELTGHTNEVRSVAFSSDGATLVSGSYDKTVRVWDLETRQMKLTLRGHLGRVYAVALSSDGTTIASGGWDFTVRLWNAQSGEQVTEIDSKQAMALAFSPTDSLLAAGCIDGTVQLWDVPSRRRIEIYRGHVDSVKCVAFSPHGQSLASGAGDKVKLWTVARVESSPEDRSEALDIAIDDSGATLATATGNYGSDSGAGEICIWNVSSRNVSLLQRVQAGYPLFAVDISADGKQLITGGGVRQGPGVIERWDLATGKRRDAYAPRLPQQLHEVAISADGRCCALASLGGISLWNLETDELRTLPASAVMSQGVARSWSMDLAFSPVDQTLAAAYERDVKLWDLQTYTELDTSFRGHTDLVMCVSYSPDGTKIASGGHDGQIKIWDVATAMVLHTMSADSRTVVALAFSPDGRTLASVGQDRMVRLWHVATGSRLAELPTEGGAGSSLLFLREGKTLAVGCTDNSVKLWHIDREQEVLK